MRLQTLYLIGALAVTAIPFSAGAQSLSANEQSTVNSQAANQSGQKCPRVGFGSPPDISGAAIGALLTAHHAVTQ
jgi:hypothetical protein